MLLQPEDLSQKMLRHGMSPPEVFRYVEELRDHREDLIAELTQAGTPDEQAQQQADQRLGDTQTLAAAAIAAHRRGTLMGRHPWLFFGVLPALVTPIVIAILVVAALLCVFAIAHVTGMQARPPSQLAWRLINYGCMVMNHLWPGLIGMVIYRAAWRRGLGWPWRGVSSGIVVAWGTWMYCFSRAGDESHAGMFATNINPMPRLTQAAAAIVLIGWYAWLLERRAAGANAPPLESTMAPRDATI